MKARKSIIAAAAVTAVFAAVAVPFLKKQPSKVQITPEMAHQIYQETSPERAVALVKLAFFSEYCAHVSNGAPEYVPAYKVEMQRKPVEEDLRGFQAFDYSYTGKRGDKSVTDYCGEMTVIGPAGSKVIDGQMAAFDAMLKSTKAIAHEYGDLALAGKAGSEALTAAYMKMQSVAGVFRAASLKSMEDGPFTPDGKVNLIGVTVRPPRPTKAGDEKVNQVLNNDIESLRDALSEVIDANPQQGSPSHAPETSRRKAPDFI